MPMYMYNIFNIYTLFSDNIIIKPHHVHKSAIQFDNIQYTLEAKQLLYEANSYRQNFHIPWSIKLVNNQ